MKWETVIGLEVHVQLATRSKIFSGAATHYGAEPNTQACPVDLGLPGVLPVLNREAVNLAVRFGLSIEADIARSSTFSRKNYFYPDLPKGYQISQHELPIVGKGHLDIQVNDTTRRINITRAHLEEDAGKSVHGHLHGLTGIDLNRAGTPLLEIVSEPEIRNEKEAVAYAKTLHNLVRYIGISDGNMQEGSFRCDVNISVRPEGQEQLGTRAEIKNLNSFRFIENAIIHERERQIEILENGGKVLQETRLYDPDTDETRSMRSKEEAHDYRYFPDPDLLPVMLEAKTIEMIKQSLPELPWEKCSRFKQQYDLSDYDANQLTNDLDTANYFEAIVNHGTALKPKKIANWVNSDIKAYLKKEALGIDECPVEAKQLAQLLLRVQDQTISLSVAKKVLATMWQSGENADSIIEKQGLKQVSNSHELESIVDSIITENPSQVQQYRQGKEKLIAFFMGKVMQATHGKANPGQVNALLKKKLKPTEN